MGGADGRKKVYFYNTSIGGLLGNTEKFLKKNRICNAVFSKQRGCLLAMATTSIVGKYAGLYAALVSRGV